MNWFSASIGCDVLVQSFLASSAHSQVLAFQIPGDDSDLRLGASVAGVGDVDLDGVPDFIVGSHTWLSSHYGQVLVISGRTGAVLHALTSPDPDDGFGASVLDAGDLDLDGISDFVVGVPGAQAHPGYPHGGVVKAYSGRDARPLWAARSPPLASYSEFGTGLARIGDIDGDGVPDIAVGPCAEPAGGNYVTGSVRVLSGRDGSVLLILRSMAGSFGLSIAGPGDVNGDGVPDILVGAPLHSYNGFETGSVFLFSGADGSLMWILHGPAPYSHFGIVGTIGDVDHDGHPDLLIGAPKDGANGLDAGSVSVYSWATGALLRILYGNPGDKFGSYLSAGGDVNGDGVPDLAVGAPGALVAGTPGGAVRLFSGLDGSMLTEISCLAPYEGVGPCALLGDLNGDGLSDIVIGVPGATGGGSNSGSARVYLLGHLPPTPYCQWKWNSQNCGSTPFVDGAPSLSVGDGMFVHIGGVLNRRPGFLLWGLARANLPFGGGVLCVQPLDRGRVEDSGGNPNPGTDCTGTLGFRFTSSLFNSHGLPAGTRVFCQFLSRDDGFAPPNNVGLSQGLAFTVLP